MILTAKETLVKMKKDPDNWEIPLMNLVDDYRRHRSIELFMEKPEETGTRFDPLLAATVETLCDETKEEHPEWTDSIEGLKSPWFVSGLESLKAIAIVESPIHYRSRNIFVHTNFLFRV